VIAIAGGFAVIVKRAVKKKTSTGFEVLAYAFKEAAHLRLRHDMGCVGGIDGVVALGWPASADIQLDGRENIGIGIGVEPGMDG